jgi:hypothetical protein
MFRISGKDDFLVDVEEVEEVVPVIRSSPPGRYHVDEIAAKPLRSRHTVRRWGIGIKHSDGAIVIRPDPSDS